MKSIVVIDNCPDDPQSLQVPPYLRGFLYNGHYAEGSEVEGAEIFLYARDVFFGVPKLFIKTPMATLKLARTLAHEVGHHVINTKGYVYDRTETHKPWTGVTDPYAEKIADSFAADIIQRMLKHRRYRVGKVTARALSTVFFKVAIQDYWDGNYRAAAESAFRAHTLNLDNDDAGQCYRHAIEKLKIQEPTTLSSEEATWLIQRYNAAPMRHCS